MVEDRKSALLIEPRDVAGMARGLGEVLNNETLARSIADDALVVAQRYSPEARLNALLAIYRGLKSEQTVAL
jgi:glycosyltransferase involved in cell wall biosynthesis